jgi:renal tumor antigen
MHKYKLLGRKGEGTFSEVLKAQSLKTSRFMAIKCMKHVFESLEQVNSLREIQALRRLSPHPNIVKLHEVLFDQPTGRLALVFELMDCNIYELIKGRTHYLAEESVRIYLYQLMKAVDHMHRHGIFHRLVRRRRRPARGSARARESTVERPQGFAGRKECACRDA